MTDLA